MLFGNQLFPILLRFDLWLVKSLLPRKYVNLKRDLQFILDHPRRVYYMLFPVCFVDTCGYYALNARRRHTRLGSWAL